MKHLVKDNKILMTGLPSYFVRENGEGFIGGYENRTDIHYSDGWREEEIPIYNAATEKLGEPYFDNVKDKVVYQVIQLDIDIDSLLQNKLSEFEQFQKEFRKEITELFLEEIALGTLSDDVKRFIVLLQQRKVQIIDELQGFYDTSNIERLLNYKFYTDEAEQFKMALTMLKD